MKRNYVRHANKYTEASSDLDHVYTQEIQTLNRAWGLYGFWIGNLLSQYRLDQPELPRLSTALSANCGENGLFLHDTSGLAPHLLGLYFLHAWHHQQILHDYEQVFWLPFMQLKKLPHQPSEDSPATMQQLASLMHPEITYHPEKKTLIIITGIDYLSHDTLMKDPNFEAVARAWHTLISTQHWISIGNCTHGIFQGNTTREIALPPTFLNLSYAIEDSDTVKKVTWPGNFLVQDITTKTSETFRFDLEEPNGVFSISRQTLQAYLQGKVEHAVDTHEEVRHDQPLLSSQEILKFLAGTIQHEISLKVTTLDTPAKWHYAARSAARLHESQARKKFYLYQVGGQLIVRRMTGNSINYLSSLGEANQCQLFSEAVITLSTNQLPQEIQDILSAVLRREKFETLSDAEILNALRNAKSEWIKANKGAQLPKEVDLIFKKISDLFKNNLTDAQIDDSLKQQPQENKDASYQQLQRQLNEFYQSTGRKPLADKDSTITNCLHEIMKGHPVDPRFKFLSLLLAVNLLAETARAPFVFFAPYAMLHIMQTNTLPPLQGYWQRFGALPERIQIPREELNNWRVAVIADGLDALGGIHPMAHNGSFFQVSPEDAPGKNAKKPQYGVLWPEFKAQILYGLWLISSISAKGWGINLSEWQFAFQPKPRHTLLTKADSNEILCDFELLQRLQTTYAQDEQNQNILVMYQQPFNEGEHLIAHPQRITLIPCEAGTYGYMLAIVHHNQPEPHFVHLNSQQAHMIATKMDAKGNEAAALSLFNYLCTRHPKNRAFRIMRALHLVFRKDYITDPVMRRLADDDISFLRSTPNLSKSYNTLLIYIQAILALRQAREEVYLRQCTDLFKKIALEQATRIGATALQHFTESDEEYATLHGMLSEIYAKLASLAQKTGVPEEVTLFSNLSAGHFITYTLTRRHNNYDACYNSNLTQIFHDIMEYNVAALELIMLCSTNTLTKKNSHVVQSEQKKSKHLVFIDAIQLCIENFSPFMGKSRSSIQLMIEKLRAEKHTAPRKVKQSLPTIENHLVDLDNGEKYGVYLITHQKKTVVLIKLTWEVPTKILLHWLERCGFKPQIIGDDEKGVCLYIPLDENKILRRGELQPIPHPDAFLTTAHHAIPAADAPYFLAFQAFFNNCVEKIKQWSLFDDERFPYHLFSFQPELPALLLIQKENNIQDVLIALPPGVPIDIIRSWLAEKNFSFHLANDSTYGRCFCVTTINVTSTHAMYNAATSNASLLEPYLPTIPQAKVSEVSWDDQPTAESHDKIAVFLENAQNDQPHENSENSLDEESPDESDDEFDDELTTLWKKAQSHQLNGDYAKAIDIFEDLMRLEPTVQANYHDCACTYFCLGMQNKDKQHFPKANELFKKAIELDPTALNSQVEYANFLYKMKKYDACLDLLNKVLQNPLSSVDQNDTLLYHPGEKVILPEGVSMLFNEDEFTQIEFFHPQILAYYLKILCLKKPHFSLQTGDLVLSEFNTAVDSLSDFFQTTPCAGFLYYKLLSNAYLICGYQESAQYVLNQSEKYKTAQLSTTQPAMLL